jgi:hypothetical protein
MRNFTTFQQAFVWTELTIRNVRFQALTAASMMFRVVFWVILPCKMIVDRRFRGAYCLHHQWWWRLYCRVKWLSTNVQRCVLPPSSMMMEVILPCKMIVDQRFRGVYCLHHQWWWRLYCRVKWLSTNVSEVCTASIINDDGGYTTV